MTNYQPKQRKQPEELSNAPGECVNGSLTFREWLVSLHVADHPTPLVDLAQDVYACIDEGCLEHAQSYNSIKQHVLECHSPCDGALAALEQASKEYTAYVASHGQRRKVVHHV